MSKRLIGKVENLYMHRSQSFWTDKSWVNCANEEYKDNNSLDQIIKAWTFDNRSRLVVFLLLSHRGYKMEVRIGNKIEATQQRY